jgi:3-methyladenine DNA glycosylase AlkD
VSPRARAVLAELKGMGSQANRDGMARYAITARTIYGVSGAQMKPLARKLRKDHRLALELRKTGVFEARTLAAFIADPAALTRAQMDAWVKEFENWADCDTTCIQLFARHEAAFDKAMQWSRRREEIVRRAGFSLMAALAVHAKKESDARFLPFLGRIEEVADDDRKLVRKAANWALRQIGKRSRRLHGEALRTARRIAARGTRSARWIASDALRELQSPAVKARLARRG